MEQLLKQLQLDHIDLSVVDCPDQKRLVDTINNIEVLAAFYETKAIPNQYLVSSLNDLVYRVNRYFESHGFYGLSEHDVKWLKDVFDGKLFDIGVLRFQIFAMDHQALERSAHDYLPLPESFKLSYPNKTMVLNIHIAKGTDLSIDRVVESLNEARHFFKTYFPEITFELFMTRTWLIHPGLQKLLDSQSNLVQFGKLFKIVAKQNITYQILERVYGTRDIESIKLLPKTTTLQQKVVYHLDEVGVALGILEFN